MHVLPEEVPFHLEVLCAVGNALINSKEKSTIVVFEDLILDRRREDVWDFDAGNDFREHGAEGQEHTHCGAESGVFGFESGQGDLTLEVSLPQDRTSAKSDDASSARLRGSWGTVRIATVKASEVGVDVTVEVQVAGGLVNHAHFAGAMQIANKSLDGRGVALLWAVAKPGNLADGKRDVWASVGREVKKHTDDGAVAIRTSSLWWH